MVIGEDGLIQSIGTGHLPLEHSRLPHLRRPTAIAVPGFVNTHGHAAMTLLRGIGDDLPLMDWLNHKIYPNEAKLTGDAVYWGTTLAVLEMLKSGTTCFTDMYFFMHDAAQAVAESGMRGVLSWGMVGLSEQDAQKGLQQSREFVDRWHGAAEGRIQTTLGPHAPYTCPPAYLREIVDLSAELNVPIQVHLSETSVEVRDSFQTFGCSPIAHSLHCGLFERPVLAAHCVHIDDGDMEILQTYDVRVAHNPQSNLKLASGVSPVPQLLSKGVTVGLGTDGASSNNNLDMFEELRLAATLHKGVLQDALVIPAAKALEMATVDGARAVFLPATHGTLTPGASADIVLLDGTSPHFMPSFNLVSNLVYSAGAQDVTDVFVAGRQLLSKGEPLTIDTERLRFEVRRIQAHLA